MSAISPNVFAERNFSGVLFDLDGTLLDTAADIATALNRALAEQQLPAVPEAEVRRMIGRGVPVLIERALQRIAPGRELDAAHLRERYEMHYEDLYARHEVRAAPYPGVREGLARLHGADRRLAVVTNKSQHAAVKLLEHTDLAAWLDVVIGGDSGLPRKPQPEPLWAACERLGVPRSEALMVGDSQVDVQAARAAQLPVVCVPYGYNEGNDPRLLPADAFIESLRELPRLLNARLPAAVQAVW